MKARKVKHLDPDGRLDDNIAQIVAVRLDELCGFMPQARDPAQVTALHDLRIAAKRLRYVLELFGPCFGPYAPTAAKKAKKLQAIVGEIHDCDVTLPRVEQLLAGVPAHDPTYRGLASLAVVLRARRAQRFEQFLEFWTGLERDGFRARLTFALTERPAPAAAPPETITPRSHDGNGHDPADDLASEASA
jgi:CHAD domain-containing protein